MQSGVSPDGIQEQHGSAKAGAAPYGQVGLQSVLGKDKGCSPHPLLPGLENDLLCAAIQTQTREQACMVKLVKSLLLLICWA